MMKFFNEADHENDPQSLPYRLFHLEFREHLVDPKMTETPTEQPTHH